MPDHRKRQRGGRIISKKLNGVGMPPQLARYWLKWRREPLYERDKVLDDYYEGREDEPEELPESNRKKRRMLREKHKQMLRVPKGIGAIATKLLADIAKIPNMNGVYQFINDITPEEEKTYHDIFERMKVQNSVIYNELMSHPKWSAVIKAVRPAKAKKTVTPPSRWSSVLNLIESMTPEQIKEWWDALPMQTKNEIKSVVLGKLQDPEVAQKVIGIHPMLAELFKVMGMAGVAALDAPARIAAAVGNLNTVAKVFDELQMDQWFSGLTPTDKQKYYHALSWLKSQPGYLTALNIAGIPYEKWKMLFDTFGINSGSEVVPPTTSLTPRPPSADSSMLPPGAVPAKISEIEETAAASKNPPRRTPRVTQSRTTRFWSASASSGTWVPPPPSTATAVAGPTPPPPESVAETPRSKAAPKKKEILRGVGIERIKHFLSNYGKFKNLYDLDLLNAIKALRHTSSGENFFQSLNSSNRARLFDTVAFMEAQGRAHRAALRFR